MLDKDAAQPLYLQLEAHIRQQIESGELNPGDRLPSEKDIAAAHGISRMTARHALDVLVTDGLLERHPGRGTFVSNEKMLVGGALNSFSGTMRGLGLAVSSTVLDLKLVDPPPRVAADLRLRNGQKAVYVRRVRYINGEPMAVMASYMDETYFAALRDADLTNRPITQVMEAATGAQIVSSQDYVEASIARPEEAQLLGIRIGAPVLLGRGVVFDAKADPVRTSKVVYRGDRFRLSLHTNRAAGTEIRLPMDEQSEQWLALSFNLAE